MPPIPLLAQVPTLPASPPIHPWHLVLQHPLGVPKCPLMPLYPFLSLSTYTPCQLPNTSLTPEHPLSAPLCHLYPFWLWSTYTPCQLPNTPLTPPTPLGAPMPLYPFWPLHTYTPCQPPIHPWHPKSPQYPWYHLYPFWVLIVTLQLTVFTQLKCSFSIIVIFNCHHFATDCLHKYVQFTRYHL